MKRNNNMGVGIAIGMAVGTAIGAAAAQHRRRDGCGTGIGRGIWSGSEQAQQGLNKSVARPRHSTAVTLCRKGVLC